MPIPCQQFTQVNDLRVILYLGPEVGLPLVGEGDVQRPPYVNHSLRRHWASDGCLPFASPLIMPLGDSMGGEQGGSQILLAAEELADRLSNVLRQLSSHQYPPVATLCRDGHADLLNRPSQ